MTLTVPVPDAMLSDTVGPGSKVYLARMVKGDDGGWHPEVKTADGWSPGGVGPAMFAVPPGHVLKVVVEMPEGASNDECQEADALAARWVTGQRASLTVRGKVSVFAVPAPCPECGMAPPRHHHTCFTGIQSLIVKPPTDDEAKAIRADLMRQMSDPIPAPHVVGGGT